MHIFITGGTRGIGRGMVKSFLSKHHVVSYTGTSSTSVEKSYQDLHGDYYGYVCDVRNEVEVQTVLNQAISNSGEIDIWINNAGVDQERKLVDELSYDEIRRVVDINLLGSIQCTKTILDHMKKVGYGRIYLVEGLGSNNMVIPKTSIYGTTKRAISYFAKALKKEVKSYENIKIGTIQPGMVFTDLLMENMTEEGMKIANIIGNDVDYATEKIVNKILENKHTIKVTGNIVLLLNFLKAPFHTKKNSKLGTEEDIKSKE